MRAGQQGWCSFAGWKPALPGRGAAGRFFAGWKPALPGRGVAGWFFAGWKPALPGRSAVGWFFAGWKPALPGRGAALPIRGLEARAPRRCGMLPRASQMSRRRPRGAVHGPFVLTIPHRQTSLRLCVSAGISTQSSQSGRAIAALGERAIHMAFGQLPFVNNYHRRLRGMAGTQGRRDTGTQRHRDTETQRHRDAETQGRRDAGTQGRRDTGTDDEY